MTHMQETSLHDEINQEYFDLEEEDDCMQEVFINANDKTRRKPIWETANANDDIIKCIGSLRIEYADKNILTNPPECSIGTGTIIAKDAQNMCSVLTHSAWVNFCHDNSVANSNFL
eukprot:160880_1